MGQLPGRNRPGSVRSKPVWRSSRTRLEALEKRELPQLVSQLDQAAREEKLAAEERCV